MTEKYVSYGLAVKLKAEGFREPVSALWIGDTEIHFLDCKEIKFGEFSHVPEELIDCFFEENYG